MVLKYYEILWVTKFWPETTKFCGSEYYYLKVLFFTKRAGSYPQAQLFWAGQTTTVPSTIVPCKKRGIYPSDHGIYPRTIGIKLDLCICTIPTVGFYRKHGEVTSPPSSQNHKMIHMKPPLMTSPPPTCRRLPPPAVARRHRCHPVIPSASQCGDWCGSDIVLKNVWVIWTHDAAVDGDRGTRCGRRIPIQ